VTITHIVYETRDPAGLGATATEGLMVPTGSGANCVGPRPVLLYAHGTTTKKSYNTADTLHTPEALLVEAFFAAHGYIVVAPNYLGYDESSLTYHPYLNAEVQAGDMVDGLRAAKSQLAKMSGVQVSKQLFIAGYSQGGHVAMATHRAIEQDFAGEFTVTAAAPMSGPYDLVDFGDTVTSVNGEVNFGGTLFMPYLLTSYQKAYGDIYSAPSDAYQAPFVLSAPTLFPTDTPVATLMQEGLLPNDPTFRLLFGEGGLLTNSFREAYIGSNFRKALQQNTLLGWNPKAPVALCGGSEDLWVYFTNTINMQADFASRGISVPVWDLEDRKSLPSGSTYDEVYAGFQLAKLLASSDVQMRYHGELVPPFCYALARGYFAQMLEGG
jgi:pimeloyl-ACP methyl ester carboxylesterase